MGSDENTGGELFLKSAYYTGKLLHATDLIREQNYGNSKLEFVNRKFHGWGIIEGLEVQVRRSGNLFLSKGSAIDPQGRILAVRGDRLVNLEDIEGLQPEKEHDFVLGIRYAEQTLETERDYMKNGEIYQPSVIAETYTLHTFELSEYRKLMSDAARQESILTEERVLYENGAVELLVKIPKVVPADSLFKVRVQVRTVGESNISIGWHGMLKLQGAVFAQSGESAYILEEEPATCSGILQREWEICTEENRMLPVMLEISHLEIVTGNTENTEIASSQFQIETVGSYEQTVEKYLRNRPAQGYGGNWVPLACLKLEETAGQDAETGNYRLSLIKEEHLRIYVSRPCEEAVLKRIAEENGILDIRWRKLLRHIWRYPMPLGPIPPLPPEPRPPVSPDPPFQPPENILTEQRFWELLDADRKNRIRRGIIVIPVPKHYRRGQILLSEEISHGFPGEEVFLRCSRVWEEQSYAYWERDRKRYRITYGNERLFPDVCDGQEIVKQALLQNVESGTFQVALILGRGSRRKRSKEVAISWIAVRSI